MRTYTGKEFMAYNEHMNDIVALKHLIRTSKDSEKNTMQELINKVSDFAHIEWTKIQRNYSLTAYIKSFTKEAAGRIVECYVVEEKAVRSFSNQTMYAGLFSDENLYVGKQYTLTLETNPGQFIVRSDASTQPKLIQKLRYWSYLIKRIWHEQSNALHRKLF